MNWNIHTRAYVAFLTFAGLSIFLGTAFYYRHQVSGAPVSRITLPGFQNRLSPLDESTSVIEISETDTDGIKDIPNIVHYVWIVNGAPNFRLDFRAFISIYSSYLYFNPIIIYIHTDATPQEWEEALKSGDQFTKASLNLPPIQYHLVDVPTHTTKGYRLDDVRHRSDFLRVGIVLEFGGIYLDTDVIPIRDILPLRQSGFANVVGNQDEWRINNGVLMSKKGSAMMSIFNTSQHDAFDGRWTTHSVDLLSHLSYRMQAIPHEVLVLGKSAFSPAKWTAEEITKLFGIHEEAEVDRSAENISIRATIPEAVSYWDSRLDRTGKEDWEIDYSGSYLIHAYSGNEGADEPKHLNLKYILGRRSNLARATYPVIRHAIDAGIIKDV